MEDQKSHNESHAVGREIQTLGEQDFLKALQAQDPRLVVRVLAHRGQDDPHAQGYRHERQGLLDQMRPAFPLPRPAADHVTHGRACEPSGRTGNPGRDVQQLQDEVGQLGCAQGQYRRGREADQSPPALAAEPSPQRPGHHTPRGVGDLRRYRAHGFPSLTKAAGSVTKVYSTGARGGLNGEVLQVSDTPVREAIPGVALRRSTATDVVRMPARARSGIKQRQPTDR